MKPAVVVMVASTALAGCASSSFFSPPEPPTQPESAPRVSGYTYIPLDPFPVKATAGPGCKDNPPKKIGHLLKVLPDNAVRMLVEQFTSNGGVTYGASKVGTKGERYRVTVDYINADTVNFKVWLERTVEQGGKQNALSILAPLQPGQRESFTVYSDKPAGKQVYEFNLPVYVGIGMRVIADVDIVGANANVSGLGVLGVEADAQRVKGSLTVQTLGVNGKAIAAALPIQNELNRTTAQNAIVAVASIKSQLYGTDDVYFSPRVVGVYVPFPAETPLINAVISEISSKGVQWKRPCTD